MKHIKLVAPKYFSRRGQRILLRYTCSSESYLPVCTHLTNQVRLGFNLCEHKVKLDDKTMAFLFKGIALINGTQFIAALGAEAVERANNIAFQADVVAALTLEALQGTSRAFDSAIHEARPHKGQLAVASRLRKLLQYEGYQSEIYGK